MMSLEIYDEVNEIFVSSGLKEWEELLSFPTHQKLVFEFYSTFESIMERSVCQGWAYSMNNMEFKVRRDEMRLGVAFGYPMKGKDLSLNAQRSREFLYGGS